MKNFKPIIFLSIFLSILIFSVFNLTSCGKTDEIPAEKSISDSENEFLGYGIIDYSTYMQYNKDYKENRTNLISQLYYNDKPLPKDSGDDKYFLPVSPDNDNWLGGSLTFAGDDIKLYFIRMQDDIFSNLDIGNIIAENKLFIIIAINEEKKLYSVNRLVLTGLPIMTINNKHTVRSKEYPIGDADADAIMKLFEPNQKITVSDIKIHTRGGSSRSFPKIGYKMNLVDEIGEKSNLNLLGMRNDDDWHLIPMYSDESKIRDKLTYDLWSAYAATNNNYNIHNGPQAEYIELFLNDTYWGLYMLVVGIDKKQQNLQPGEIICKSESWEVPKLETLKHAGNRNQLNSITVKKPDKVTQDTWNKIYDIVDLWFEMPREEVMKKAGKIIDLDNIIDYWIFINITKGKDNGWKNIYMTWKKNTDNSYTVLLAPWDCDLSWGVMWAETEALLWEYQFYLAEEIVDFQLGNRLIRYNYDNAVSKLQKRWNELRKGILDEKNLFHRIDDLTSVIHDSGAWKRDLKRWPHAGHSNDMNEYLKEFTKANFKYLDDYISGLG